MVDSDTLTYWCEQLFDFLFIDKNGKFQWLGATGIGAILTIWATSINNKKNLRANILYKKELDGLDQFKDDCANLSSAVWTYNVKLNQMGSNWENNIVNDKVDKVLSDELTMVYTDVRKYNSLVRLEVSSYGNDQEVTKCVNALDDLIQTIEKVLMSNNQDNHVGHKGVADKKYAYVANKNNAFIDEAMEFENYIYNKQMRRLE